MVNKTSDITKDKISQKSAYALPIRPSDSGMKPDEIRKAFWSPVIDDKDSVLAELDRIVDEANAEFDSREKKVIGSIPHLEELNREATENVAALKKYDELVPKFEEIAEQAVSGAASAKEDADRAEALVEGKVDRYDKVEKTRKLYGVDLNGEQVMFTAQSTPMTGRVAIYAVGGCLRTNEPIEDNDCANKAYVLQKADEAYNRGYNNGLSAASWDAEQTIAELESKIADLEEQVSNLEGVIEDLTK